MLNYWQRFTIVPIGIFLFSTIFPSLVYAAVITCGLASSSPCNGTYGDDNMKGDPERNWMNGLDGNDRMSSEAGNDRMHAGYGNDQLNGGAGDDSFYGSVGADSFKCGTGIDRIDDFNAGEGDTKSTDCENTGYGNRTGVTNETLTGFLANDTLSTSNSSSP